MTVLGMGERKTPNALVSACETFKFLDILYNDGIAGAAEESQAEETGAEENAAEAGAVSGKKPVLECAETAEKGERRKNAAAAAQGVSSIPDIEEMEKEIISIINTNAGEDGWVDLSELGDNLPKRVPGFDPRNYNCSKLKQFIELFDCVEVKSTRNPHNKILSIIYVRVKQEEAPAPSRGKRRKHRRKQAGEGE